MSVSLVTTSAASVADDGTKGKLYDDPVGHEWSGSIPMIDGNVAEKKEVGGAAGGGKLT